MKKIILIVVLFNLNLFAINNEDIFLSKLVNKIHKEIKYGVGKKDLFFSDEILKYGFGNCGYYSILVFNELLKNGYKDIDSVFLETYDGRKHNVIQVRKKSTHKLVTLDATTNVYYLNGIGLLVDEPKKYKQKIGESTIKAYSDYSFWNSIKKVWYFPYKDAFVLQNIKKIYTNNNLFYKIPNNVFAMFDYNYSTYAATKINLTGKIKFKVQFKKSNNITSIVIYPYSFTSYPKEVKLLCNDNVVYNNSDIQLRRNLIVINFIKKLKCNSITFILGKFKGQNRLLIRDIYIYGKTNKGR